MTQAQQLANLSQAYTAGALGFRNKIINGNFDIWQRGTSAAAATGYNYNAADHWLNNSAGTTIAPSRQAFTLGQTAVPGEPAYFHRSVVASSAGAGNYAILSQWVEGVRSLAGSTVTASFYAKADAARNIAIEFEQHFGSGGSPSASVTGIVTTRSITTAWSKVTVTAAIPSIAGKTLGTNGDDFLRMNIWFDAGSTYNARTNSLGQQSGTFDIARVQLEVGAVATPYEDVEIGETLRRCQRYFERIGDGSGGGRLHIGIAAMSSSTVGNGGPYLFKVKKRAAPTVTINGPTLFRTLGANQGGAATLAIAEIDSNGFGWSITGSSYTQGQVNLVQAQDAQTPTIDVSAEL